MTAPTPPRGRTKHTPGPWTVVCGRDVVTEHGMLVANTWSTRGVLPKGETNDPSRQNPNAIGASEADANAHLIAASPTMRDAIETVLRRCSCEERSCATCKTLDASLPPE